MTEALGGTERQGDVIEEPAAPGASAADPSTSEPQSPRTLLRNRWELASVLNFLRVFEPVIKSKLGASAEEIEDALISQDELLSKLHVTLLQGIPPVSRNLGAPDAWITHVCKQLSMWWTWVAEGEVPLVANRGAEIQGYKELDPVTRLLILKALCEIRAEQDDIIHHIDETLKNGSPLATFRKDKIGDGANGTTYWYDGDPVIGHRFYKQNIVGSHKHRARGKDRLAESTVTYLWETLACDLEEFQKISDDLSESKIGGESSVGNILKTEILPVVERTQKRKERLLKRQQREVLLLAGFSAADIGSRRSCRDRKPVKYTFDEYDRSIKEAIQTELNRQPIVKSTSTRDPGDHPSPVNDSSPASKTNLDSTADEDGYDTGEKSITSADDEDYNDQSENDDNDKNKSSSDDSSSGSDVHLGHKHSRRGEDRNILRLKIRKTAGADGLRRSTRHSGEAEYNSSLGAQGMGHAEMKKRLRQRPTRNTDYSSELVTDSEDETSAD